MIDDPDPNFSPARLAAVVKKAHPEVDDFWLAVLFGRAFDEGYLRAYHGLPHPFTNPPEA